MNDWGKSVLEQYEIEVFNAKKGRGALILETNQGLKLLQPYHGTEARLKAEAELLEGLKEKGHQVDAYVKNKEESLFSVNEWQEKFVLKDWYAYEECQVANQEALNRACRALGSLHKTMRKIVPQTFSEAREEPLVLTKHAAIDIEMEKHTREMKRVNNYMKQRRKKTTFETMALSCYEFMYGQAKKACEALQSTAYRRLYQDAVREMHVIHGDFQYHNILLGEANEAIVNFEHAGIQLQIKDLYDFVRKILEKKDWDMYTGLSMLEAYGKEMPLCNEEWQILSAMLAYPERYWKQLNYYYNTNKAWIPAKSIEKLECAVRQTTMRAAFIAHLK